MSKFVRKIWRNNPPNSSTPINADELNRIEEGIVGVESMLTIQPLFGNTDLNDIDTGVYVTGSPSHATLDMNYPVEAAGFLYAISNEPHDPAIQHYTTIVGDAMYVRTRSGGGTLWREWFEVSLRTGEIRLYTTDLNDVVENGIYSQPTHNSARLDRNYPHQITGILTVNVALDSSTLVTQQYQGSNGVLYIRSRGDDLRWTPWADIAGVSR